MKKIKFTITTMLPATPEELYNGWLDSRIHGMMTGGTANISNQIGAPFTAWDGYITGINLELEEGRRIYQKWRTTEFEESDEDSLLEVIFKKDSDGTKLTLNHTNLPPHGMQYKQGWVDSYFEPMRAYFSK